MSKNFDKYIEKIYNSELLQESEVKAITDYAKVLLSDEPNIIRVDTPVNVCGDVHGQLYDLMELFNKAGNIPDNNYLFIGDFVDRGFHSVETFLLLLLFKVRFPDRISLLRGNHECRELTQTYGFYDECIQKYGQNSIWRFCVEVFDLLPLSAIINRSIFAVHGGLSPQALSISKIQEIQRQQDIPRKGEMTDLVWSDPIDSIERDTFTTNKLKKDTNNKWMASDRGAGYLFNREAAEEFLRINNIEKICRAHQLCQEGYNEIYDNQLITIWSAPDYVYRMKNKGAVLQIDDNNQQNIIQFEKSENPKRLQQVRNKLPDIFL